MRPGPSHAGPRYSAPPCPSPLTATLDYSNYSQHFFSKYQTLGITELRGYAIFTLQDSHYFNQVSLSSIREAKLTFKCIKVDYRFITWVFFSWTKSFNTKTHHKTRSTNVIFSSLMLIISSSYEILFVFVNSVESPQRLGVASWGNKKESTELCYFVIPTFQI